MCLIVLWICAKAAWRVCVWAAARVGQRRAVVAAPARKHLYEYCKECSAVGKYAVADPYLNYAFSQPIESCPPWVVSSRERLEPKHAKPQLPVALAYSYSSTERRFCCEKCGAFQDKSEEKVIQHVYARGCFSTDCHPQRATSRHLLLPPTARRAGSASPRSATPPGGGSRSSRCTSAPVDTRLPRLRARRRCRRWSPAPPGGRIRGGRGGRSRRRGTTGT
eukprot:TRINITY_DN5147_c0_g1_i1.p1 TRINITY_DN5147_c0_g1~~TRINITY_DN5147_c0_g1_i1.p1  ORF type:complete len:221 (+),score=10.57 TRINITY_DN5147_c0_g1_i1:176-838(+)